MNALEKNFRAIGQASHLWKVILDLSTRGCEVVKFTSGEHAPSLQLSQPLDGIPTQQAHHAEKIFETGEHMGCRVYWEIKSVENQA